MSSSFFVRRGPPDDAAAVIAALDRPGVRWADGDLDELVGPWPDGVVLLWIPGASTRGVEISQSDGRMCVRILAMSTPQDYDLAFRLVEVLAGDGSVESEDGDPFPAAELRTRFDDEWIKKSMTAGAAAIGAALARGKRVTMSGPGTSVRIEPVQPFDAAAFLDSMRNAQAAALVAGEPTERAGRIVEDSDDDRTPWQEIEDGDLLTGEQEHQEELRARDRKLTVRAPASEAPGHGALYYLAMALLLLPALVVRLVTLPLRASLRKRRQERAAEQLQRERETCREEVVRETAHLAIAPHDIDARRRRADRLRRLGHRAAAERDLAFCLDRLPEHDADRPAVLLEHASVLRALDCPNLAAAAQAEAVKGGAEVEPPRAAPLGAARASFLLLAGLAD